MEMKPAKKKKLKVIVAMSGGVDSSVSALLLKKAGFSVEGLYMKLPGADPESLRAAEEVAGKLEIKFHAIDLEKKFRREIIGYFLDSYRRGLTPNPCVRCNQLIKFGELLKAAEKLGADFLATGHYVRKLKVKSLKLKDENQKTKVVRLDGGKGQEAFGLLKAKDKNKDQSYFLWTLRQEQLKRVMFPLGGQTKEEVREIADSVGLPNIKKESQDICFLYCGGKPVQHNEFLRKNLKLKSGPIRLLEKETGEKTGERKSVRLMSGRIPVEHQGLPLYTIGQRREIRIGGTGPYYAAKFDVKKNILYVVKDFDDPILYGDELAVKDASWVSGLAPKMPLACRAVIRYRHAPVPCIVMKAEKETGGGTGKAGAGSEKAENKSGKEMYRVKFKTLQRAITPGQSIVFYKGNEVLGGGVIKPPEPAGG